MIHYVVLTFSLGVRVVQLICDYVQRSGRRRVTHSWRNYMKRDSARGRRKSYDAPSLFTFSARSRIYYVVRQPTNMRYEARRTCSPRQVCRLVKSTRGIIMRDASSRRITLRYFLFNPSAPSSPFQ